MAAITPSAPLLCALAALLCMSPLVLGTTTPVIGVLTVPVDDSSCSTLAHGGQPGSYARSVQVNGSASCFESFYVQWLEASGLQVAVIPFDLPTEQLDVLLNSVNGVLFTGGGLDLEFNSTYYQTALHIYNYILERNDKKDSMPLWGTCMGFQLLNIITANNVSVLDTYAFDSESLSLPLDLTPESASSRMLGAALPADVRTILTTENVTSNLHHDGVRPSTFYANERLSSFYTLLSTNADRKGNLFTSTMEGKKYPIYGAQWHAERPQFEWVEEDNISHTANAVRAMQYIGDFLAEEVRKSNHAFTDADLYRSSIIYTHQLVPDSTGTSNQYYVFGPQGKRVAYP